MKFFSTEKLEVDTPQNTDNTDFQFIFSIFILK